MGTGGDVKNEKEKHLFKKGNVGYIGILIPKKRRGKSEYAVESFYKGNKPRDAFEKFNFAKIGLLVLEKERET